MVKTTMGLLGALWLGGCAFYDSVGGPDPDAECTPGQSEPCRCDNSGFGQRVCTDEGTWWGCACVCDGIWCEGVCTAYQSDVKNCGRCGNECAADQVCYNGFCLTDPPDETACGVGKVHCDGACVNLDGDPDNCGSCGNDCGNSCICIMGTCAGGGCGEGPPGYRELCSADAGAQCAAGLVCVEVEAGIGYCLYPCDYPDGTCPDGGSCLVTDAGGICFVPGEGESGAACDPFWRGCAPGLDCIMTAYPYEGTCHARCDCATGDGCGQDDPGNACSLADAGRLRCWCQSD